MAAYSNGQAITILHCGSFYLLCSVFLWPRLRGSLYICPVVSSVLPNFFPRLISAVADWMSPILPHGVALVWIENAGLKRAARLSLEMQEANYRQKFAIWAPSHNFVGLYQWQSEKKLSNSNISPICPHNTANFGPFAAEIGWRFGAPQQSSTAFASWQRYCTALWWWVSAKLCGVEQRALPIFGRAAITLSIDPHSSHDLPM